MESLSEPKRSWPSWLFQLAAIRIGGAISGLGVTYWAVEHLSSGSAARFIGNSSALANGLEAITALFVGLFVGRVARASSLVLVLCCSLAALYAWLSPGQGSLWLVRAGDGVIAGLATTSALSQVLQSSRNDKKGPRLLVAFEAMVIVSFAVGSVVASLLWLPFATSIFLVTAVLYLASMLARPIEPTKASGKMRPALPRSPLFLGVVAMSASASMWVSQVTFVLSGQKVTGQVFPGLLDKPGVSVVVVTYLIATGIGLAIWSLVLTKINVILASTIAVGAAIVAPILLLVSNLSSVAPPMRGGFFVFYAFALLAQTGLIPSFMAISNRLASPNASVQLASAFVISTAFGSVIGPLLGGYAVAEFSFSGLCISSCVMAVLALASLKSGMGDRYDRFGGSAHEG